MDEAPELSIVIASYNARETIAETLDSLRRQRTLRPFEVIVVDSSQDGTGEFVAEHFPEARLLRYAERKYCGSARNAGIAIARAPVVAFTDADCVAQENYVEEVLRAHKDASNAVGGAIAQWEPANGVSWAAYFCEFSNWMPGWPRRKIADMAGANLSYKMGVFDKYGQFIEGSYGSDTDFNWRMGRDGYRVLWRPSILVYHRSIGETGRFLRHEFLHGQHCARMRIRNQRFSVARRWVYAVCAPLIPLKLLGVVAARNLRNRTYFGKFLRVWPLVLLGLVMWSAGESTAYLRPEQEAMDHEGGRSASRGGGGARR